eukprot:5696999-Amphidinium_carterae.2
MGGSCPHNVQAFVESLRTSAQPEDLEHNRSLIQPLHAARGQVPSPPHDLKDLPVVKRLLRTGVLKMFALAHVEPANVYVCLARCAPAIHVENGPHCEESLSRRVSMVIEKGMGSMRMSPAESDP